MINSNNPILALIRRIEAKQTDRYNFIQGERCNGRDVIRLVVSYSVIDETLNTLFNNVMPEIPPQY